MPILHGRQYAALRTSAEITSPITHSTFVIACGLATLETAANSYATVIGNPKTAARRLQFCQSWNGVASFIGPLIASHAFFNGANENSLTNVQYVYLAVACAGTAVNILFICEFCSDVTSPSASMI